MNRPARRPFRLGFEPLEDRWVPATITVNDTSDGSTLLTNGQISLREAIESINQGSPVNSDVTFTGTFGTNDTINFAPGTNGVPIVLNSGELPVTKAMVIQGNGATNTTISGGNVTRVFNITAAAGTVTIGGLTIADGQVQGFGAGILNAASLTVDQVTFNNNNAIAIPQPPNPPQLTSGGAIDSDGPLTVTNSTFTNNSASSAGGAIRAQGVGPANPVSISNSTFSGNTAANTGGAIYTERQLTINGSTFTNNTAPGGAGGAITNLSDLTVTGTTFTGNTAGTPATNGPPPTPAVPGSGGAIVSTSGTLSITGGTFLNNTAVGDGGALDTSGTVTITTSTFQGNQATNGGSGGAIYHDGDNVAGASLNVTNSLFTQNTADTDGGAVYVADESGNEKFTNVTFFQNAATLGEGGALYADDGAGVVRLVAVTINGNTAAVKGGGVGAESDAGFLIFDSIAAGNSAGLPSAADDLFNTFSEGGNVIGVATYDPGIPASATAFQPSDVTGVTNPGLATSLANNGGPTLTLALQPNSPALGRGIATGASVAGQTPDTAPSTDQRLLPRPSAAAYDAGAFQAQRPTAAPDAYTLPPGTGFVLTVPAPGVLANDAKTDPAYPGPLQAVLVSQPTAGSVALNPDGSFTYTAPPGYNGTATFTYAASDGVTASPATTVTITVSATHLFAVGAGAGEGSGPRVRVFKQDGTVLYDFMALDGVFNGGVRVAVGDVDGDGTDDVVVTAGPGGGPRVQVYNGATGALVKDFLALESEFRGGLLVAVGDLNGDGKGDIVVGAGSSPDATGSPRVRAFDSAKLLAGSDLLTAQLASFFAYDPGFHGGVRVAVGDANGDGTNEIVTAPGPTGGPDIRVFDPHGTTLYQFFGFDPNYRGGAFVSVRDGAVFVSPDSFPEFAGSTLADQFAQFPNSRGEANSGTASESNLTHRPEVYVFVGGQAGSGSPVQVVPVLSPSSLGGARISAGTYNSHPGLFVAAGPGGGGRLQFYRNAQGLQSPPELDRAAFDDPAFPYSVYVGG